MDNFDMWLAFIIGFVYSVCIVLQYSENKKLQAELNKAHMKNKLYKSALEAVKNE